MPAVERSSPDGSADLVRADFPQARLIESPMNGGFSYANNLGLRAYGYEQKGVSVQIADHLLRCRERWGFSYFTVRDIESFSPVVELLAGT